jgi:cephalosporin hydroxylase
MPPSPTPSATPASRHAVSPADASAAAARFHEAFYYARLWQHVRWLGVPAFKCPLDLWIYQEILHDTRPDVIIETGTAHAGSALFLATVCDALGRGRIITIDPQEYRARPRHARITYLAASSIDAAIIERVRNAIRPGERVMAVLDSLHNRDHVLAELRAYGPMVTPGCYLIAEDTNINGHPVQTDFAPDQGPGPFEAVETYLRETDRFEPDGAREKFLFTFNPRGYLKCVKEAASGRPDRPR